MSEQPKRELRELNTELLQTAAYHRRTFWGDMGSLTASVKAHGVIEPPVVRALSGSMTAFEVICGERRRRAALAAGIASVMCIVVDVDTSTAIQMQIAENRDREGLHPIDEASYFSDLNQLGFDAGDIAARFSVSRKYVERRLRLCALPDAAREEFAKGAFDERAAIAIARLDTPDRRTEVLNAFLSGALLAEEIESYCQREHTASLEDVPWRVSDDAYKGGACTSCPKRSSVQRDLFDEVRGDRCLDLECFRDKMDSAWRTASSDAQSCDLDTPSLFIPQSGGRPVVMKSSQMVDAEALCPFMLGHTWGEAVAKSVKPGTEPPARYVARDQDGRPRFLFRESLATRVIKKGDAAKPIETPAEDNGKADARAEARIRRALVDQLAVKISESKLDDWGWVVERIIDMATARSVAGAVGQFHDDITQLGVDLSNPGNGNAGLVELVRKSNRRARQVAFAILVREEANTDGELPDSLRVLAKDCDVDVRAIERQVRKADK